MIKLNCKKCGQPFTVSQIVYWKFSNTCTDCIIKMDKVPYDNFAAEDSKLDGLEELNKWLTN